MNTQIVECPLSDGSSCYDVIMSDERGEVARINAEDLRGAMRIKMALDAHSVGFSVKEGT